ncbi:MAG: 2-oxo acid dehydrogenase subunit E2, partial [Bdellovibrionaceae bacterium]|nr:2-oxo acid dehydrogenase subunit E2 [Pseudobdellovibrionaceae bacterium]
VGLAPLVPYSRCGLVVALGKTSMKAIVTSDGRIEAAPVLNLTGTFDHRLFDGFHIAKLVKFFTAACADPKSVLGDQ